MSATTTVASSFSVPQRLMIQPKLSHAIPPRGMQVPFFDASSAFFGSSANDASILSLAPPHSRLTFFHAIPGAC